MLHLLFLACDEPDGNAVSDKSSDETGAVSDDSASDTSTETGQDSGVEPWLDVLSPENGARLFLNTRYDLIATVSGAESASATFTGATGTCDDLLEGVLHCSFLAESDGAVHIDITASGATAETTAGLDLTAKAAEGVVPEGEQFAMGTYELMNESWFEPVASAKFNVAQSYGTGAYTQEEWQEWAAEAGMLTMTRPSWSWSDPWGDISRNETLTWLAARPEIAWWELPDNPVEDDSYTDEVSDVVELIRGFDDRPTQMYFWTSSTTEDIAAYVPDVNVISPGSYPEHACQPQPWVRYRITTAREAVAMAGYSEVERPVVGTADLYQRAEESCPERMSELAQVRMNPLAIIASGAHGVLYFAWWYAATELDPAWGESARETSELIMGDSGLGLAVVHGVSLGDLAVTVTSGPSLSEAFTPAQTTDLIQYPSIHAAGWDYAGTRFVVAVNYTNEVVVADIAGFPTVSTGAEVVGEYRTLTPLDGVVSESFEGWGAHVYRAPIVVP